MYYTVYKTTNLIDYKIYIGCHKTEDPFDEYLGSGKYITRAIEKHGIKNFSKDIIAICDTEAEMYKLEEELVNETFLKFFSTYNIVSGGLGGFSYINSSDLNGKGISKSTGIHNWKNRKHSISTKQKMSELKRNTHASLETKTKMSISMKNRYKVIKHHNKERLWITNGSKSFMIRKEEEIPNGYVRGMTKK